MARALIESQAVVPGGMWPTLVPAVAAGHRFANTFGGESRMFLLVTLFFHILSQQDRLRILHGIPRIVRAGLLLEIFGVIPRQPLS